MYKYHILFKYFKNEIPVLWCKGHPKGYWSESQLLCFQFSFLLMHLREQQMVAQVHGLQTLCGRPEWSSGLLTLAWLSLGCCGHLEKRRASIFLSNSIFNK